MEKGWRGLLPLLRGAGEGEASGRRVEGCLRLSRASGLSAVEATPVARLRSCVSRMVEGWKIGDARKEGRRSLNHDQPGGMR